MLLPFSLRLASIASVAALATACVIESADSHGSSGGRAVGGGSTGTPTTSAPAPAAKSPILVDVDTDKIMDAQPGQGVGVFIEYAAGGHWYVWWTCDTKVNPQGALTCDFLVRASVAAGTNLKVFRVDAPEGAVTAASNATTLEAHTITGDEVHGMHFDTDPGAIVTLDASIGGTRDAKYFFFVQNGRVNGGYTGQLSNPLMVEGSTP